MKLLEVCIGSIRDVVWHGKTISTGIFKSPVQGKRKVTSTGIENDGVADLKVHGGIEKAIYAYGYNTYPWWGETLKSEMPDYIEPLVPGAFGENLVVDHLDEAHIYLGDVFSLGSVKIQVSEPRFPCFKLGIKFNNPKIIKLFLDSKKSGVYFRVLEEGLFEKGDSFKLINQETVKVPVSEIVDYYITKKMDSTRAQQILTLKSLAPRWRQKIESHL